MEKSAFDITIAELNQLLQSDPTGERHIHFNRLLLRLPSDKADAFRARMMALEAEMLVASSETGSHSGEIYSYTATFVPTLRTQLVEENEA